MPTLAELCALAARYADDLNHTVAPLRLRGRATPAPGEALIMGVVNLSRQSTYRSSIAPDNAAAIQRGRILAAQGAHIVDLGAESSTAAADLVSARRQIDQLVPVIEPLAAEGIAVSVESYHPDVVEACLQAGAAMVNLSGAAADDEVFATAAQHDAAVLLCYVPQENVRQVNDMPLDGVAEQMLASLSPRVQAAREAGVSGIVIDPGLGFYYGNLTDPALRTRFQTEQLLQTFRLRSLGVPVCQSLPHAFDLFTEHYRSAEAYFAVLALLGQADMLRTHEVGPVHAVTRAMGISD